MEEKRQPVETELKLAFPAEARVAIEHHPTLAAAAARTIIQHAVYYDTPDLALRVAGFNLRVRRNDGALVQTLKSDAEAAEVATKRGEWEWEMLGETPDVSLLSTTPAASFSKAELQPAFEVKVTRVVRQLALRDGADVELALDDGLITSGTKQAPILEMELELKSGSPASLYRLALELHAALPLRILTESKAARGYQLRSGNVPMPVKGRKRDLDSNSIGHAVFQYVVGYALSGLARNQPAAYAGSMEGTHQMRIAIRKLRTALVLFEPLLEPHASGQFDVALRRLGHVLGEARDWDVFCRETLPTVEDDLAQAGWGGLIGEAAEKRQTAAYEVLRAELAASAITGLALGLAAWAADETALGGKALSRPLTETAPALLDLLASEVFNRGQHLKSLPPEGLHRLRKMLKKLRYGAEYVSSLYDEKPMKRYLKPVKHLQKLLGEINDAAMATSLAERLCEGEALDMVPSLGNIAAWAEARRAAATAKLPRAWRALNDAEPFWSIKEN
jgi:triphosphatase